MNDDDGFEVLFLGGDSFVFKMDCINNIKLVFVLEILLLGIIMGLVKIKL